jgi:hypothetical protein
MQSGAEARPLPFLGPARARRIPASCRILSRVSLATLFLLLLVLGATHLAAAPPPDPSHPTVTAKSHKTSAAIVPRGTQGGSSVPAIAYATYLGNSHYRINAMALGTDGTIHVAGVTLATAAVIDPTQLSSGGGTAFIARLANDGSQLLYFKNLGTGPADEARAIAVDSSGNAYVTGFTKSKTFPTVNALQATCSQDSTSQCSGDAFVAKLNAQGEIVYSTYLGGSGEDAGNAITIDAAGNAYVAGTTTSTDFPTLRAAQPTIGGAEDAFVAKLSADGSHILFATFLGGKGDDEARGIALDAAGNIFVTGATSSLDFPTHDALQSACVLNAKGTCAGEAFVSKISAEGSAILYSTYLGGSGGDAANAITVDAAGGAYITGLTSSTNFPLANPIQPHAGGKSDAFVSRFSPDGQTLIFSTYLGGSGADQANSIALDSFGNVFISGWTSSPNFPTLNAVQSSCKSDGTGGCSVDSFALALNASGSAIGFATYLGGSGVDDGRGIAIDAQGAVYLAGSTTSADFPAAKLMQPAAGNQTASAGNSAATDVAGGAFAAKISGVSINGSTTAGSSGSNRKNEGSAPPDPPTLCTGTTTNWLGGTGKWSNAAMWSTGVVPNSNSTNVCIDDGNAAASVVTLDITATAGTLTIDSGDALIIGNNSTLIVAGNISNSGQIQIAATVNTTVLSISGTVSLSGSGNVTLSSSSGGTPVINQGASGSVLTNVSNTIQGIGQIGNNGLTLANQTGGIVNANGGGTLLLNAAAITNQGLLESTAGTLQITTGTNNAGGTISATGTGAVQFLGGSTIQAGAVSATGGGVLGTGGSQTITLDGSTHGALTIAGVYTGANNSTTIMTGTINNTGSIQLAATVNTTVISVNTAVTLMGGGSITLSSANGGTPVINQAATGSTLTNVNNILQGVGQIGNNSLTLVNQAAGIVNANVSGAVLLLNAASITNQGLLEATNGGVLQTTTTINNQNATITANGKNSSVQFLGGSVIQGGTLSTLNTGVLGSAASQTVTLDGMAHGTLTNSGTYTGANNSTTILFGTIANTGTIQVAATVNTTVLSISGSVNLTGAGTVTLSSASGGTPVINEAAASSTLTNVGNTIQGVGQIGNNGLAVVNQGTISANTTGTLLINPVTLTNQGLLAAPTGATLQLTNGAITNMGGTIKVDGTMSVPAGFTVNGGVLSGAGTISGSVVLGPAATAQPGDAPLPGILTVSGNGAGNYTQGSSAAFTAVIGGTTAGTQYSQLNLTGAANLSGVFSVTLANGFTPAAGAQFTIINAASVTGQFLSSNLPNLPAGLVWNVIYNPTSVVLVAAAPASIAVTPANPSIAVNATLQFTATATFAGGGSQNVTNSVTWASTMPTAATINATGLATGVTAGQSTTISATLGNVVGSTLLSVTGSGTPALTQVIPNTGGQGAQNLSVAITGQATHFAQASSVANFGAGIAVASLTINSPTSATAVINIAQAAALGARTVTVTSGAEIASLTNGFTVTALTLNSIAITPNPPPSVAVGATEQFTATGTFSDGSTQNLTSSATWVSSMTGFATISNAAGTRGLATGVAAGTTTITASVNGVTSPGVSLTVTGTGPTLTSITVAPPSASVAVNNTQQFTATGHFSDGSTGPVTVNWTSSNMAIATINAAGLASGVAVGGPITITATSVQTPAVSGTAQLTVTAAPPTLTSITVAPPMASIAVNATQTFAATGHFSDGSSGAVTVTWSSSNNAVATINAAGTAMGVSAGGPIMITATSTQTPSVSSTAQLTVTAAPPTLTSITVAPPTASIAVNATQTFAATGHFSDGSSGAVNVNWTTSNMAVATINLSGVASGVSAGGPITITASSTQTPSVSGTAQLTVTAAPPALTSITVTPPSASIAVDATQSFAATGHFSDGSSAAVTVTWSSSNNSVATINAAGTATGVSAGGPVTIKATSTQLPGISGTAQLTVTGAALVSIAVTPANPSALTGATLQFHATGTFADNSTKDLTATVTWASSNTEAATIVAGGLANLLAAGHTTISATLGETSGSTVLAVTNAPFTLTVSPPPPGQPAVPVVAPGGTVAFGLVLTPIPGFSGTVQFACTTTNPTITCAPDPNSVTLTPSSPSNVAIVLNTFCKGTTTTARQIPRGLGGGSTLLLIALACGGAALCYRRRQGWALSFAALILIVLGSASCSGLPKGPNGPTQPGEVTVTVTASANGATVTAPPLQLIVE